MNIKECKVGMTVRAKKNISASVSKGDEVKIIYAQEYPPFIDVDNGDVIVPERSPEHFEKIDDEISMVNELVDDFIESNPDFKEITEEIQMVAKKKEKELLEDDYSKEEVRKKVVEEIARLTMLNFGKIIKSLGGK